MVWYILAIVLVAFIFDYINGFHDSANSIATIVGTRVLSPFTAVAWAATFNFIALFLFDTSVAKTIGKGMIDIAIVNPDVILAGPSGADRIRRSPAWAAVRAVREGRVLVVDTALVGRPGVRMGEAAAHLRRLLDGVEPRG